MADKQYEEMLEQKTKAILDATQEELMVTGVFTEGQALGPVIKILVRNIVRGLTSCG